MPSKNEMAASLSRSEAVKQGVQVFDGSAPSSMLGTASNARKLFGFTRKQLPPNLPTEPYTYIYSVSEYGDLAPIGPGFPTFEVKACPPNEDYGPPCVVKALYFQEEAQVDKTEFNPHTSQQIIDAILRVGPGMTATVDRGRIGWFASKHNPPLPEEVERAVQVYTQECKRLLAEGNTYASAGRLSEINETHRRAANYLRQKVDWDKRVLKMVDCCVCGEAIKEGTILHAPPQGCGAVQPGRWPDAIRHGIKHLAEAPADVQREMGYKPPAPIQEQTVQEQVKTK